MGKTEYVGSIVDLALAGLIPVHMLEALLRDEQERELFMELFLGGYHEGNCI